MDHNPFRDQVVIITGPSAGIGRSLALQLAGQGAMVVLAARRAERLEAVAAECRALGGESLVVPTDVSDESQCKALVEKTIAAFGRLDMLINNAGLAATALFEDFPDLRLGYIRWVRHIPLTARAGRIYHFHLGKAAG